MTAQTVASPLATGTEPGGRHWTPVAQVSEVAAARNYLTVDLGRTPAIVMRDDEGELRGFVNMCRHRGMALLEGCGTVETTIRCPYHAWQFDVSGRLRVIPQRPSQFAEVDQSRWSLLPISVAVWRGLVLAHPDAGQPDPGPELSALAGEAPESPVVTAGRLVELAGPVPGYTGSPLVRPGPAHGEVAVVATGATGMAHVLVSVPDGPDAPARAAALLDAVVDSLPARTTAA